MNPDDALLHLRPSIRQSPICILQTMDEVGSKSKKHCISGLPLYDYSLSVSPVCSLRLHQRSNFLRGDDLHKLEKQLHNLAHKPPSACVSPLPLLDWARCITFPRDLFCVRC